MSAPAVRAFTPMLHVADVLRGAAFYALMGFEIESRHNDPRHGDQPVWVALQHPGGAELMLVLADGPVDAGVQAVLFYVYCDDVAAMHAHLRAAGVTVGAIGDPFYRPDGEFRVADPDGYVCMVTHL